MTSSRLSTQSLDSTSNTGLTFALQALLSRHESFVTNAQEENDRLSATVAELQSKRQELQTANEKIVAENRELLEQLDTLNASYKSSDEAVKNLEEQLRCTELEVGRLTTRARRAEELEACVQDLHLERTTLQGKLDEAEAEGRTTLVRWRESEGKIRQLELELDKIEWESRLEREKHDKAVARLEHERVVDRELSGAEARLKGAAAVHEIGRGTTNNNVVSSFVRDILKDNASLQAGIVELRDLLQSSNDDVQSLRQQVMYHQPLEDTHPVDEIPNSLSLDQQLGWHQPASAAPAQIQPEVHVHHHYHAKILSKRDRTITHSRTTRRRAVLHSATPRSSVPSTPRTAPLRHVSSPVLPHHLHQGQARRNRWSGYSSAAGASTISSIPSTPRSAFDRYSSIFDRIDLGEESSRPTSPESAAGFPSSYPDSDTWLGMKKRRLDSFDAVIESEDQAGMPQFPITADIEPESLTKGQTQIPKQDLTLSPSLLTHASASGGHALPELQPPPDKGRAHVQAEAATPSAGEQPGAVPTSEEPDLRSQLPAIRPLLHPSRSQDSLVSISGMDIHIAKRPTASLLNGANSAHFAILPSSARSISASQPVASITDVTATSSQQTLMSSAQGPAGLRLQSIAGATSTKKPSPQLMRLGGLGGWMRARWGAGPTESVAGLRSSSSPVAQTPTQPDTTPAGKLHLGPCTGTPSLARKPGINQSGAIPGLWPVQKVQRQVMATLVDAEGLRAVFEE
ncbi:hypothetical protein DV736_g3138, partial [Chaetothyriales sp. CBS 134916]